ncbi:hypothetical protein [Fimbriimonas ginsengisoli]|uniref:Uncharacterized protein n=1 Tax=Fimbriimonas ginsengisoli Gsoil 348 TaxID=661478 RepID=A0A068NUK3_FIMGI|nr:hypothetical protein [Fimbriimonas ginsengisoli]AIE87027.1 hypothetical protein OP10G_3659 [Fimbriimonas ginsengisoli Gsoil 348]
MKRMLSGFGLAVLTLAALPILPDFLTIALRIFTCLAVAAYLLLTYLAYVPSRVTVGLLRFFALIAGVGFACELMLVAKHLDLPEIALASAFAGGAIVAAVGPFVALSLRRKLYFAFIVWLWLVIALLASTLSQLWASSLGTWAVLLIPIAARLRWELAHWEKTGQSVLVHELEQSRTTSWQILAELRFHSREKAVAAWEERQFCAGLVEMRKREATSAERYEELIRLCRAYPRVPLAWRLAYSAAISRGDHLLASELLVSCEELGQREVLDTFNTSTPEAPWLTWRQGDKRFERAQDDLASIGLSLGTAGP